jgi:hypothetical protein
MLAKANDRVYRPEYVESGAQGIMSKFPDHWWKSESKMEWVEKWGIAEQLATYT